MNYDEFKLLLSAMGNPDNEIIKKSLYEYDQFVQQDPLSVIQLHLNNITDPCSFTQRLSAVLLGRLINVLGELILSYDMNQMQNALFLCLQQQNVSSLAPALISRTAKICTIQIWPNLTNDLLSLTMQSNFISASAIDALTECIELQVIDPFDIIEEIGNIISFYFLEEIYSQICYPSLFRLIYSIMRNPVKENLMLALVIDKLPSISYDLINQVMSDLCHFYDAKHGMFQEFLEVIVPVILAFIKSEDCPIGARNSSLYLLSRIVDHFPYVLYEMCNGIFDNLFCVLDTVEDASDTLSDISFSLGGNFDFAMHTFDVLKENVHNPNQRMRNLAFIAFGSVIIGIKEHFLNEFYTELISIYNVGFNDQIDEVRFSAFKSFRSLIEAFNGYANDFDIQEVYSLIIQSLGSENNPNILIEILKLLRAFLISEAEELSDLIPLIQVLFDLFDTKQSVVLDCIKLIAKTLSNDFVPYSMRIALYLSEVLDDQTHNYPRKAFFKCIESIPYFENAFESNVFVELSNKVINLFLNINQDDLTASEKQILNTAISQIVLKQDESIFNHVFNVIFATASQEMIIEEYPMTVDINDLSDMVHIKDGNVYKCFSISQRDEIESSLNIIISFYDRFSEILKNNSSEILIMALKWSNRFYGNVLNESALHLIEKIMETIDYSFYFKVFEEIIKITSRYQNMRISKTCFRILKIVVNAFCINNEDPETFVDSTIHVLDYLYHLILKMHVDAHSEQNLFEYETHDKLSKLEVLCAQILVPIIQTYPDIMNKLNDIIPLKIIEDDYAHHATYIVWCAYATSQFCDITVTEEIYKFFRNLMFIHNLPVQETGVLAVAQIVSSKKLFEKLPEVLISFDTVYQSISHSSQRIIAFYISMSLLYLIPTFENTEIYTELLQQLNTYLLLSTSVDSYFNEDFSNQFRYCMKSFSIDWSNIDVIYHLLDISLLYACNPHLSSNIREEYDRFIIEIINQDVDPMCKEELKSKLSPNQINRINDIQQKKISKQSQQTEV